MPESTDLTIAQQLQALVSPLIDRMKFANRAGLQFDGCRNVFDALGYNGNPRFEDYMAKYRSDPLAARIVDAPPSATWRSQPLVTDDLNPETETEFEKAWLSICKRLQITETFERLDRITGVGHYGALLIGLRGQNSTQDEVTRVASPDDVLFLQHYSEGNALIGEYDADTQSPRFGLPLTYNLQVTNREGRARRPSSIRTHHSRLIHVVENALEDDVFGRPRLRTVYNLLDDCLKVVGGSAETYWLEARRGLHANIDKDAKPLSPDKQEELKNQIDEYINNMRRVIRTQGMELNSLGGSVANPQGPFDVIMRLVSVGTGIPVRILTGSERGELASTQDDGNWASRIEERQVHFAEPMIVRPLVDRLIFIGALPKPKNDEYFVEWKSLSDPGERERAETAEIKSRAAVNYQNARRIVSSEEAREDLGFEGPPPDVEDEEDDDQVIVDPDDQSNDETDGDEEQ